MARLSGSVSEIWSSPVRSSSARSTECRSRRSQRAAIFSARWAVRVPPTRLGIALVQAAEIVGQARIRLGDKPGQGGTGEVAVLVVDRLDPGAVHRDQLAPKQVEFAAQQHERAEDLPEGMTVVAAEVGNGFEVGLEVAKQPDHLNVPPRLCL